jgi:hypothetical protein
LIIENTTGLHRGNNCSINSIELLSVIVALSAISPVMPDKICTEENNNNNSDFNGYFSMVDKDNK